MFLCTCTLLPFLHPKFACSPRLPAPRLPWPAALGGALDVALITQYVDAGNDLLLAVDSDASEELRELAQEVGVDVDASGKAVIDHFEYDSNLSGADHTVVASERFTASKPVLGDDVPAAVLFQGIGLSVAPESETVGDLACLTPLQCHLARPGWVCGVRHAWQPYQLPVADGHHSLTLLLLPPSSSHRLSWHCLPRLPPTVVPLERP